MRFSFVSVHEDTSWQDSFTIRGSSKVGETNGFWWKQLDEAKFIVHQRVF